MKTVKKNVYYCDFCTKKGMSAGAMGKHEKHCTANPDRICRMCVSLGVRQVNLEYLLPLLPEPDHTKVITEKEEERILEILHDKTEGCPICIFSALRQRGIATSMPTWQLKEALEQVWADNKIDFNNI